MRTSEAFILGTITGAVVIGLWGRTIEEYVGTKTRGVRAKTAAGLRAVEEKTGSSLRRAEEFLHDTKEHVTDALRAGQKAIDPASTTGAA